jgi:hypothetical protein
MRRRFLDDTGPVLRWERLPAKEEDAEAGAGNTMPQVHPPPVPGERMWWGRVGFGRWQDLVIWRQTWPVAVGSPAEAFVEHCRHMKAWMDSLEKGDTIVLSPTDGFFVHDIAKFSVFGIAVYSSL